MAITSKKLLVRVDLSAIWFPWIDVEVCDIEPGIVVDDVKEAIRAFFTHISAMNPKVTVAH